MEKVLGFLNKGEGIFFKIALLELHFFARSQSYDPELPR
jgi:hypothetical protein